VPALQADHPPALGLLLQLWAKFLKEAAAEHARCKPATNPTPAKEG